MRKIGSICSIAHADGTRDKFIALPTEGAAPPLDSIPVGSGVYVMTETENIAPVKTDRMVAVNAGALRMVLNIMERHTPAAIEAAEELEKTVVTFNPNVVYATRTIDGTTVLHSSQFDATSYALSGNNKELLHNTIATLKMAVASHYQKLTDQGYTEQEVAEDDVMREFQNRINMLNSAVETPLITVIKLYELEA